LVLPPISSTTSPTTFSTAFSRLGAQLLTIW
jgi:hypothetical protein